MPTIDLKNYVVSPSGNWLKDPNAFTPAEFILSEAGDQVTFTGPVALAVTLQSENRTLGPSGADEKLFFHDVYTYSLVVPPGNTWTYRFDDNESQNSVRILAVNRGLRVLIRPGLVRTPATPVLNGTDLPCDFAVSPISNSGQFFPAGCEPCPPGLPVGLPPGTTATLVEPAAGGCVRPRFFNGMFITREDMETEQRFFRMKNKMQNRAMGKGVVWGLNLQRHANSICVEPGYAVDCCGNDLVLTEPYRVSIDALLRDPASFRFLLDVAGFRRSAVDDCDQPVPPGIIVDPAPQLCRRMHLLLEYVECPQDARPVHGDPCSPEVTRCEMSRIRETVRLRLIPPRDYDPKGPIDKFLDELNAILKEAGLTNTTAGSTITASTTLPVPFQIDANLQHPQFLPSPGFSGTVPPDRTTTRDLDLGLRSGGLFTPPLPPYQVRFQVRAISGNSISAGQVVGPNNVVVANLNPNAAAAFDWTVPVPTFPPNGFGNNAFVDVVSTFTINQWQAAPATGQPLLTGSTTVTLSVRYTSTIGTSNFIVTLQPRVSVAPTEVQIVVPSLGPYPCSSEACGCDPDLLRFPVFPPFLHKDPRSPNQPVDWKVLLLAVAYGLLVSEEARHHTGTPQAVITPRLQLALNVYVVVLSALFGANTPEQRERLTRAMRCLFQAWCKALLYPGPECEQGIHGVVVGCAQIRGGRIVDVDPWGGRRWVLHYPLVTYWGHQFGIAPLDVTASRLFSMICCLGDLPAAVLDLRGTGLSTGTGSVPGVGFVGDTNNPRNTASGVGSQPQSAPIAVGHIFLVAGTRAEAVAQLRSAGVTPVATRELGLPEFLSTLLLRLREQPSGAASQYTLFALQDSPGVHFAAPVSVEASGVADAAVQTRPAFVDRLPELVAAAGDAKIRATIPPLLRSVSETITAGLLRVATIPRIAENPGQPLHQKLAALGVSSYGALLSRKSEEVLRAVGADLGKELSDILVESEAVTASGAKAVSSALANVAKASGAVSPRDLNNEEVLTQFGAAVTEAISKDKRLALPEPVVSTVVSAAVKTAAS